MKDTPAAFRINGLKPELVDTCTPYEVAFVDVFQKSIGLIASSTALLVGEASVGTAGTGAAPVVKFHTLDQLLLPMLFVALTRQ